MSTIYAAPEQYGLAVVAEVDRGECYGFDMFVVWRKLGTKRLLYATDRGCSCPSAFEDMGIGDLKDFTVAAFDAWLAEGEPEPSEVRAFRMAVRAIREGSAS